MITLKEMEGLLYDSLTLADYMRLCEAARRGVEASNWEDEARRYAGNADYWRERAEEAVAERDAAVVANCPRMCDDFCNEYQTVLRAEKTEAANVKLVGAIDMIRETLNGSNVQDLLLIINGALDEARNV